MKLSFSLLATALIGLVAVNDAAMEDPCPMNTLARSDFKMPNGTACILCSTIVETCEASCASTSGSDTVCTTAPEDCGTVACPTTPTPSPNPDYCPEDEPVWVDDETRWGSCTETDGMSGGSCIYSDPYCGYDCFDGGWQMWCAGGGMEPPPPEVLPECSAMTTCRDCLNQEGCGGWSTGNCYSSCGDSPADASCYSQEVMNGTLEALCGIADNDSADQKICSSMTDCAACKDAATSDGSTGCEWFESAGQGYCSHGCGMDGCGVDTCPDTTDEVNEVDTDDSNATVVPECSATTTCLDCLNQEGCGAWSTGFCYSSCGDSPADASCYSQEFMNGTPEALCGIAANDEADQDLCSSMTDCAACKDAATSDGSTGCEWFESGLVVGSGSTVGQDYCNHGCGMDGGCGVDTCSDTPDEVDTDEGNDGSTSSASAVRVLFVLMTVVVSAWALVAR